MPVPKKAAKQIEVYAMPEIFEGDYVVDLVNLVVAKLATGVRYDPYVGWYAQGIVVDYSTKNCTPRGEDGEIWALGDAIFLRIDKDLMLKVKDYRVIKRLDRRMALISL